MRKHKYKDLPPRLYWSGTNYIYRRPDGRSVSLGADKKLAIKAAERANAILAPKEQNLMDRIMGTPSTTIADIMDRYWDEFAVDHYAAKTLDNYQYKARKVKDAWGRLPPSMLTVRAVAEFVDQFPPRQSETYVTFLKKFFKWGRSKGYFEQNLAADLITKKVEIQRQRLCIEGYRAIYAEAEPWLQNAMNLALQSLQRREDLVLLRFESYQDGILPVRQLKTGSNVRIAVGPELHQAINQCRDSLLSPYMIHKRPSRITTRSREKREHHTQVLPEQLTRAFTDAREASRFYAKLVAGQKPTFHEIRALGAKLYKDAGVDPQPLLGHKDEASTRIYLDRHEEEWIEASAGLKL